MSPFFGLLGAVLLSVRVANAASAYAPVEVTCPTDEALVRSADSISTSESDYVTARKAVADTNLLSWLTSVDDTYSSATTLPLVGLTTSGGGYRSLLSGAGVIQAFDSRDSSLSVAGIYQSLTYQGGLSGGSWLLSSIIGNNWTTISELRDNLWTTAFEETLIGYEGIGGELKIKADITAKDDAGFDTTLTDPWGRLLSYQLLEGSDGGVATTLSGVADVSNFTSYGVPFPIITAIGVNASTECAPGYDGTQYEFSPFEFGSWDSGFAAFTPTKYLGSNLTDGSGTCYERFDNLGFIFGTSSAVFAEVCSETEGTASEFAEDLIAFYDGIHDISEPTDLYSIYPNPFRGYSGSSAISSDDDLYLVDGGLSEQNNPIWPFIQDARAVDVLIVNDNSADTDDNWPNGTEIYHTYLRAQEVGLTLMPVIPDEDTFVSEGLNQSPTFFGCDTADTITIVYLPNYNYTYDSNVATLQLAYSKSETDGIIANGNQIASDGGDVAWAGCLACALMKKTGETLPDDCDTCFDDYCYN
ncbi:lysophospholipase [Saccharata proteae CBS 121410]|uniref:Lysophospholipase n=1 Tax=Saccharata proteae CBS 121410 TaxID=1314787 RepID=A0A9P4LYL5_9PEZI|nr:lysophospholipase [Saccharata proteae CBS 121410]